MSHYLRSALESPKDTRQISPIPGRESEMVQNTAGGFVFESDAWSRLRRFLILGSEGGSYYASQNKLTTENATNVVACLKLDGPRVVSMIVETITENRAPKKDSSLYALALASSPAYADQYTRERALGQVSTVCRTGTDLFMYVSFVDGMRGWGSGLKRAVADWYESKDDDKLAYQLVKYRNRHNFTHRDVLRLSHPQDAKEIPSYWTTYVGQERMDKVASRARLYDWACGRKEESSEAFRPSAQNVMPEAIIAFERAQRATSVGDVLNVISRYGNRLPHEAIPTEFKADSRVWSALLEAGLPMTAMLRNLKNMTMYGTLTTLGSSEKIVVDAFSDPERVVASRLHPLNILNALKTYANGGKPAGGWYGGSYTSRDQWIPNRRIVDALDRAFYSSFPNVEVSNKRFMLGIDVSGSMSASLNNTPLTCAEAAAAMAMTIDHAEPYCATFGFARDVRDVGISSRDSLDAALRKISGITFGTTDASALMRYAMDAGIEADTFVVLTDNETYAGRPHPSQAIKQYRERTGIEARLVVVGMVSNGFTIADPQDAGMLDVVGFDSATPSIISNFSAGRF